MYFFSDDVNEAYSLIKDIEPTTPQEYILKGVVNAALGQEQGSVSTADDQAPFSIYGWARSQPMSEDVTYVMSSLIGRDIAQP